MAVGNYTATQHRAYFTVFSSPRIFSTRYLMPKALCLISLVASILIVVLFLADAAMGMAGMVNIAPLGYTKPLMNIAFIVLGAAMIYLSWATYREQR